MLLFPAIGTQGFRFLRALSFVSIASVGLYCSLYAHETEPGATEAPCVYSFHFDRQESRWIKRVIYEGKPAVDAPAEAKDRWALQDFERGSAGTGLQMEARDLDGDVDVDLVCPGKSGLYWFENLRLSNTKPATSPE